MRVPKRIKGTGEYCDEQDLWASSNGNANGNSNAWNYQDNFDMTVPDRIVVIGQEQHHGEFPSPPCICFRPRLTPSQHTLLTLYVLCHPPPTNEQFLAQAPVLRPEKSF